MFLKHGLQLMNYRSLVLAETEIPIVVVLPFESATDADYRENLFAAAGVKVLLHANRLFGESFTELEELFRFLKDMQDPLSVAKHLKDPSRLLFDTEWTGNPEDQLKRAISKFEQISGSHAGDVVFSQCMGRMSQATDVSWKSISLGGVPLMDAPTSWQYYNWSLEYDAKRSGDNQVPLHMSRGLQRLAETDIQWLGAIPPEALIEIRKQGALDEVRAMLSLGIEEMVALNPENFFRTADRIYDNLELAFQEHQKKVDDLKSKKWKFAGYDIGTWLVAGTVEVAAAIFGTPAWGLASAAISQVSDAPKLKDLPAKAKELKREDEKLSKSASGLLFKHRS